MDNSLVHRFHQNHTTSVTIVIGTDKAQYTQKWRDTTNDGRPPSPLGSNEKKFIPKSVFDQGITYESDLILNASIVRLRPFSQTLQKSHLELEMFSDRVPASALVLATDKVDLYSRSFMVLSNGTKRPRRHLQRLVDMHAVSCDFVQESVISFLRPPLSLRKR
ncbi:unnamed protein product [Alternaria alternata]